MYTYVHRCTLFIIVKTDVTPSRMYTTPPASKSVAPPTVSVTSTPTTPLIPEVDELDDELPTGAIVGIVSGAAVLLFIVVLIICVVAKR